MQFKQCPKRRYESDLEMAKSFGFAQERHQRTATRSRQSGGWCDSHNNSQIWQVQVTECHRHWIWMDMIPLESQSHCFRKYHFITRGLFLCQTCYCMCSWCTLHSYTFTRYMQHELMDLVSLCIDNMNPCLDHPGSGKTSGYRNQARRQRKTAKARWISTLSVFQDVSCLNRVTSFV